MKHVPKAQISNRKILSFEEAWKMSISPQASYDVREWMYVPPFYSEYRYVLGTRGKNPLIVVGVNPSTAEPESLDPTLKSAQRIALFNGYDSFWMVNVYPQRATDPNDVEHEKDDFLAEQNLLAFKELLELSQTKDVWCAWGNIIDKRSYLSQCVRDILTLGKSSGVRWLQAEKTCKSGNPHHPLYLKADTRLIPYDPWRKYSIC